MTLVRLDPVDLKFVFNAFGAAGKNRSAAMVMANATSRIHVTHMRIRTRKFLSTVKARIARIQMAPAIQIMPRERHGLHKRSTFIPLFRPEKTRDAVFAKVDLVF